MAANNFSSPISWQRGEKKHFNCHSITFNMFEDYRTWTSCLRPFSHFPPSSGPFSCHPICAHPECNCAIWFLISLPCSSMPRSPAEPSLTCIKSAGRPSFWENSLAMKPCFTNLLDIQLIGCTQDGSGWKNGLKGFDTLIERLYFLQRILGLQILVCCILISHLFFLRLPHDSWSPNSREGV